MNRVCMVLAVFLIPFGIVTQSAMADKPLELKFEKYTLANGMDVILHEDHSIPVVAVNVMYHVGSKNEKRGCTGFTHIFEHMMFKGSEYCGSGNSDPDDLFRVCPVLLNVSCLCPLEAFRSDEALVNVD